ncbi:hypothetical protein ON010_g4156 [Phytophthora cinnamomi]|nr:hypothetical protein ON010_g4156 [Phytophthora cinnamomi]
MVGRFAELGEGDGAGGVLAERARGTGAQLLGLARRGTLRPCTHVDLLGLDLDVAERGLVAPVLVHGHKAHLAVDGQDVLEGDLAALAAARAAGAIELPEVLRVEATSHRRQEFYMLAVDWSVDASVIPVRYQ